MPTLLAVSRKFSMYSDKDIFQLSLEGPNLLEWIEWARPSTVITELKHFHLLRQ